MSLAQSTTLGVVYLNSNTPNPEAAWISRGLADMLTTDLSKISKLTVVQREQLDKVLKEQALGASGAVDPSKAAQLGKVLGAQTLLTGSYAAIGRNVRVDLQLVNAATGRVEGGVTAEGSIDSIFSLEKQLVLAVLGKLSVTPSPSEMQAILQAETFNNQAVVLNYQALTQLQTDPKAAAATLQQAVALDPNYASAQKNLQVALGTTGQSLANAALVGIELAKQEMVVGTQVAQLLMDAIIPQQIAFVGQPEVTANVNDKVGITYKFTWVLKPGTAESVLRLLKPFSSEGPRREEIVLKAPGIGRNDTTKIWVSSQAWEFIKKYLQTHSRYLVFLSDGPQPVLVGGVVSGNSIYNNSGFNLVVDQNYSATRQEKNAIPLDLIKNLKKTGVITGMDKWIYKELTAQSLGIVERQELMVSGPASLLPVDAKNARELGIPAGMLRRGTGGGLDNCREFAHKAEEINEVSLNLFECTIFTKINDADFSIERLRDYLYRGTPFNVNYFLVTAKQAGQRQSLGLFKEYKNATLYYAGQPVTESLFVKRGEYFEFKSEPGKETDLFPSF